jgi:hypothetical protein
LRPCSRSRALAAQADGTVMDVAFRTDETGAWWEQKQAAALAAGDNSHQLGRLHRGRCQRLAHPDSLSRRRGRQRDRLRRNLRHVPGANMYATGDELVHAWTAEELELKPR